jgi:hypothetical protein
MGLNILRGYREFVHLILGWCITQPLSTQDGSGTSGTQVAPPFQIPDGPVNDDQT